MGEALGAKRPFLVGVLLKGGGGLEGETCPSGQASVCSIFWLDTQLSVCPDTAATRLLAPSTAQDGAHVPVWLQTRVGTTGTAEHDQDQVWLKILHISNLTAIIL